MIQKIFAVVPVKRFESSKSRLKFWLSDESRIKLTELLLTDTLSTLVKSSAIDTIIIVSADVRAKSIGAKVGAEFLRQEIDSGVNEAVKAADNFSIKNGADATIVIPHDLPLLRPQHINMIARSSEVYEKCIVICPSLRHDGTNILLRKPTDLITTHFDNNSYVRHIQEAIRSRASIFVTISDNTMIDVDTKHDFEMLAKYESNTSTALEFVKRATTLWI